MLWRQAVWRSCYRICYSRRSLGRVASSMENGVCEANVGLVYRMVPYYRWYASLPNSDSRSSGLAVWSADYPAMEPGIRAIR